MFDTIRRDAQCYLGGRKHIGIGAALRLFFFTPGFQLTLSLRLQRALARIPIVGGPLQLILWYGTTMYFGCDIAPGATFGPGLYLPHPTGIVIGEEWDVGADVSILHAVTLGRTTKSTRRCSVGDNVGIGAGAKIIGNLDIGARARVGANAVVTKSVPPGATAVGIPARIQSVLGTQREADVEKD